MYLTFNLQAKLRSEDLAFSIVDYRFSLYRKDFDFFKLNFYALGWTVGCSVEVKLHEYLEGTPNQGRGRLSKTSSHCALYFVSFFLLSLL
jgi:hypothetical protein